MTLRNAFANLATEERTDEVVGLLRRLANNLSFSRDSSDRLRVILDNNPQVITYMANSSTAGTYAGLYSISGNMSVDPREPLRAVSRNNAHNIRNRWSVT